ncbi:hypothetical protein TPA0598_17_00090 [Streptomyces lydicamycinicus]|uniref:Uncharacterized protein n=1 Tax=Streptomyces lydicamycinicus TaxID=1546107 RepID=A0A0P4RIB7_9ACTN|nr:hypothetical protein [Streptomyces lydicamycinicus]GAO13028.1 hypothetical protein TPA0598_17_00090 [Streptomyces lydicamycinicus]
MDRNGNTDPEITEGAPDTSAGPTTPDPHDVIANAAEAAGGVYDAAAAYFGRLLGGGR